MARASIKSAGREDLAIRPRGSNVTEAILGTVLHMGTKFGFDTLTVEAIASESEVAKTTIYRRWPNDSAIIMDAFLAEVMKGAPLIQKATARASFAASMASLLRFYRGKHGKTMRMLVGRSQTDEGLREALMTRWVEPRRKIARQILVRGIAAGELRPELDPDVMLDVLYGPLYHRFLVPFSNEPLTDSYVNSIIDAVFSGFEPSMNAASARKNHALA